jgi:hypothetical protein
MLIQGMTMGLSVVRLLRRLDNSGFGHIQVWEFGVRSLPRIAPAETAAAIKN